jgi:hypothetical protein
MKRLLFTILILGLGFIFTHCKKDDDKPSSAKISITIKKWSGESQNVDCNGLSVELHSKSTFDAKVQSTTSSGSATSATASFASVPNGRYYLMAWKDKDNSNSYTVGDYFGFVEVPVIIEGVAKNYTIEMYLLRN